MSLHVGILDGAKQQVAKQPAGKPAQVLQLSLLRQTNTMPMTTQWPRRHTPPIQQQVASLLGLVGSLHLVSAVAVALLGLQVATLVLYACSLVCCFATLADM